PGFSVRSAHHLFFHFPRKGKNQGVPRLRSSHLTLVLAERNHRLIPNLTMGSRFGSVLSWGLLAVLLCACNVVVAAGLDENDANRIALALEGSNVDTQKEPDPNAEGKFKVSVARDDVPQALAAMHAEELPRPKPAGVLEAMDKGALVP